VKHHLFDRARVQQKRAANGELTPWPRASERRWGFR
jgi:hypothetical protein